MQSEKPSFYWHDYETWGLSPSLDRPSQFAGLRTDLDLNIIGQADMFYCKLSDDYLPDPEAVLVTGISPKITQSEGLPEFEFVQRINQHFSQINSCVLGYNNIRFDDEFTRNIFYRNFYDPYEHSWKNGNSRWDIIDLVRATYALRPEGITWPKDELDLPSFRLQSLTEANEISHQQAHDAMSDVYATIAIAKLIKDKAPKLFKYYFDLRNKNNVKALINCGLMQPLVHVSGMFGAVRANISLVAPIVWHPTNTNAVVVVDLLQDISPLLDLSSDEIRTRLYTKKEHLEGELAIPLKLVHINKCPFLAIEKVLSAQNVDRLGIDKAISQKNLETLKNNSKIVDVIAEVFQQERKFDNKGNVDAMIYDGFFSHKDKVVCEKIRNASAEDLTNIKFTMSDSRFKELFFRYRARNFPQSLTNVEQQCWENYRQAIFAEKKENYFKVLNTHLSEYQSEKQKHSALFDLHRYVESITGIN
ncbi:MAG: exodeoxyribonuclease I [Methylococcales symbiont of Hymedesmia sp. n. MRB-2018]|nr:MAG: exodeoxyribonuclease I [Methylococcales symbiont of Hymedesmia sp. n. MRB-2018]